MIAFCADVSVLETVMVRAMKVAAYAMVATTTTVTATATTTTTVTAIM